MTYQKTEWTDQDVENPRTYTVRNNEDGSITLYDAFGRVTNLGTPVNAENMNKIEQGIYNNDQSKQTKTSLLTQQDTVSDNTEVIISDTEKTTLQTIRNWLNFKQDIKNYIETVYPVGSLYFSTATTCPLQNLGVGTWNKVGTSLTLSVNTTVPVYGNGKVLGLSSNDINWNMSYQDVGGAGSALNMQGFDGIPASQSLPFRSSIQGTLDTVPSGNAVGITTDANLSGIVGTVTRTQLTVNVFQRTE